jgi:UDP-glucuronate decarboxylase
MKRALVTGGAGFLGSHLCERLLGEGRHVLCLDNFFTGTKENVAHLLARPHFELLHHDVTVPLDVEVDEIYNLACPASPVHYQRDPVQTTRTSVDGAINMLDLAKQTNARVLQASTSEVYGDPEVHPQTEDYWGSVNPIGIRSAMTRASAARKPYSSITSANTAFRSRSRAFSTPTARACSRTTAAWFPTSSCRPCAASL